MNKIILSVVFALSFIVILGHTQDAYAVGGTISDEASCVAFGGMWSSPPDKCEISSSATINSGETLTFSSGILFFINRASFDIKDGGTVNFFGNSDFDSDGGISVAGTLNNSGEMFLGEITTIRILPTGVVNNDCSGTITGETTTSGTINSGRIIFDDGTLASTCFSTMIGGFLIEIDTMALLVATTGTNPVITLMIGITIAGVAGQVAWFIHRRKKKNSS